MGEPFVENGCEAANYLAEKYWNRGFDAVTRKLGIFPNSRGPGAVTKRSGKIANPASSRTGGERVGRRQKNRLPSPEGSIESWDKERYRSQVESSQPRRESSLDRQSEFSDQVIRAYELDPRDPTRRPANVLSNRDLRNAKMSYANGNLGTGQYQQQQGQRANSAQPPRTRNYDDEEEYGSDYDDRRGNRYQTTGRGYDDRDYDDRGFDREVIETERYRGPAGQFEPRRQTWRSNDPYNQSGQLTQYNQQQRRSTTDIDGYNQSSRRSRERGRRNSERDRSRSRSRSYSRSRSRSRSGSRERGGIRGEVGRHFDTSLQGLGVGLAGAVVGGMAGRHFGDRNPRHKNRDIWLGALVGGLGANAAENRWTNWQEQKKEKVREDEERYEQKYDPRDYGRSRSAMR